MTWFYEAPLLRGEILRARAMGRRATASRDQTAEDLAAGRRALDEAAAIGRSDPAVHVARGELEESALQLEVYGAGEIAAPFEAGIAAADRALAIDSDDLAALALRVGLRRDVAAYRANHGEDITGLLSDMVADARRTVELSPSEPVAKLILARAYRQWGEFRQGRNQDPTAQLREALQAADSIAEGDRTYETYVLVGLIHKVWADYLGPTGEGVEAHRTGAVDAYKRALERNERGTDAWLNLANNYYEWAAQRCNRDAEADLARALEALERGRNLDPGSYVSYFYDGQVHARLAECTKARGVDPAPDRDRAIEMYRRGLTINSKSPHLYNGISIVQLQAARDAADRGSDPTELLDQAYEAATRAIEVAPDLPYGYNNLGDVLIRRAAFEREEGRDPRPTAREAIVALRKALDRVATYPTSLLNLGETYSLLAAYEIDRARDPGDSLTLARQNIKLALEGDPALPGGKQLLAAVGALELRWSLRLGRRAAGPPAGRAARMAPARALSDRDRIPR
jgi:serine/threonine-protein kinase